MAKPAIVAVVLALATSTTAEYGGHGGRGGGGYYNGGGGFGGLGGNYGGVFGSNFDPAFFTRATKILTAHAVLAALAFVILFPIGGIMIRLLSFPGLWLVHGAFQLIAYAVFTAAFGMGIWMAKHFRMLDEPHAIIGIVVFVLLFFQPFSGFIHHILYKRHGRRQASSYGHIWLGRILITLGIINGGLGIQLARRTGRFGAPTAPSQRGVIAYIVVAAIMWSFYMLAAVFGEVRRGRVQATRAHPDRTRGVVDSTDSSMNRVPVKSRYV